VKEVETHFFLKEYDSEILNQIIDAIYVASPVESIILHREEKN